MTEPTDVDLDAVLCKHWPAFSMQATLVRMWVRAAMRDAIAKWDTPPAEQQAQPGAVYAELPQPDSWFHFTAQFWENKLRDFADRTHALRIQAAPRAAPVTQQAGYAEVIECGNSYAKVKLKGEAFGSVRVGDIFYTALQQDEPVGEVVSASCDHATVRWLHQTSSVGCGDPRNSRAWPKVSGVSRDEGHSRALLVFFAAEPTDDEVRAVHDTLAAAPTAQAAPQPAPATQQAGDVVAYLDVGASGYLDLGAALSEDALQQLPKGRHALVIAGTYGIDGYVAAPQPSPTTKPAPQQEAQEPVAWQGVHDQTDLYYTKPLQADVRPLYTAPQPAPAPLSDDVVKDAARWRWLSEHIGVAWNEGKFTSLVRIVSDNNRTALNASIDRMMTGDWSDAAIAAHGGNKL